MSMNFWENAGLKAKESAISYIHTKRFKILISALILTILSILIYLSVSAKEQEAWAVIVEQTRLGIEPDYTTVSGSTFWLMMVFLNLCVLVLSGFYHLLRSMKKSVVDPAIADYKSALDAYNQRVYGLKRNKTETR